MVSSITGLTRNGLKDWLVQRVSAVILLVYLLFVVGFIASHPGLTFAQWQGLFCHPLMRIATMLALLSLIAHAWIGVWTILGDYVHNDRVRGIVQVLVILVLLACLIAGVMICFFGDLWG